MNTNPSAKVILCYGDSNTWGQSDDKNVGSRYSADVRWTGRLQAILGHDYYVIEEGLGGRTTDLEHYSPQKPSRNGLTYFVPCLTSHSPVNMVVIMLGTNDLKIQYDRSVEEIANSLLKYVDVVKNEQPDAKILLVSPVFVNDAAPKFTEYYHDIYNAQSAVKSKELGKAVESLATQTNCLFFDASSVAKAGADGIHFNKQSHPALAKAIAKLIRNNP